MEVIHINFTMH